MKRKLLKTFLLAVGLLVGGSAWADAVTIGLAQTITDDGDTHTIGDASYTGTDHVTVASSIGSSCGYGEFKKSGSYRTVSVNDPAVVYTATKIFQKTERSAAYSDNQYVGYTITVATGYTLTLTNLNAEFWSSDAQMHWRVVVINNTTNSAIYTSSADGVLNNNKNKGAITDASPSGLTKLSAGTYTVKLQMYQDGGNKYFAVPHLNFNATVEEIVTPPGAISFSPAAGSVAEGSSITLTSATAITIVYQWGASAVGEGGDWSSATTYSGSSKPVVPTASSTNKILSVKATNANGSTYGSASYTPVKIALKTIYSFADGIGSQEVTANDATIDGTPKMSITNTSGRIKLTAATGTQFKDGDEIEFAGSIGNTSKEYGIKYGPTTSLGTNLYVAAGQPCHVSGTLTLASATNVLYIGRYEATTNNFTTFTIRRQTEATSEAFYGVKINGSAATEDVDYTKDGNVITLKADYTEAPSVKLVNHIVFADESTEDQNVLVVFGDPDGTYFTGTAVIDETTYTVKAPCGQINALKVEYKDGETTVKEEHLDVTGLKVGASYTVPFRMYVVKDGALYQTTNNSSDPFYGDAVTLAYNTTVTKSVSSVDLGGGTLVFFKDFDGSTSQNAGIRASNCSSYENTQFTSEEDLPAGKYTFIARAYSRNRGSSVKVGNQQVFTIAEVGGSWKDKTFTNVIVPAAGKLALVKGASSTDPVDIIIAIRTGDATVPATITSSTGYATFSSKYALDFSGVTGLTAYKATACDGESVTLVPITGTVAANTGLVIKGTTTNIPVVATGDAATGNLLFALDGSYDTLGAGTGGTNYVLSVQDDKAVFAPIGGTVAPVTAGHAALFVSSGEARTLNIVFADEATGIKSIENGQLTIDNYYDLQGQRVAQPAKGLYIVNGKKVIMK